MNRLFPNRISKFAFLLVIIGALSSSISALTTFGLSRIIPEAFEMPLGRLSGLAVDSQGNIYCGILSYSRIQVYDPEGTFLYAIPYDGIHGIIYMRFNSDDHLEVASPRGERRYLFNKDGKLISKRSKVLNVMNGFDKKTTYLCYDDKRQITYQIKTILNMPEYMPLFGEYIVKKDVSGKDTVFISTPFYKWFWMAPFPSWEFIMFGAILTLIFNTKAKQKFIKQMEEANGIKMEV